MISTDVTEGNKPVVANATNDELHVAEAKGVLLQAKRLTIRTPAGVSLLSDISFHIEPGELVALTGLSRSGKFALLRSLAGLIKPESGEILIDGINLYTNLNAFRPTIGYVAPEFAVQQNLTVTEILEEATRLRLPRSISTYDRKQKASTLLKTVGLTHVADRRVGSLAKIEKRRLSIAVELMSDPGLLLLDESAELLTPFEEVEITILLRELSRKGITIVQIDRRCRSAGLSDKVIFLVPGGLLGWFGPPDEAFIYLRNLVPRGVAKDLFGLREALEVLANPQLHEGVEWAKRFKANEAYQKYVDDPLQNRYPDLMLQTRPLLRLRLSNSSKEKLPPPIIPRASGIQKLLLLIVRNLRLLFRDKTVLYMLAIPPLVGLVDFVLSSATRPGPDRQPMTFGLLVFLMMLTGALLFQNEIFKERAIYLRESRTSSMTFSYTLSKVFLVGMLAIYQGLVWAIIHYVATGMIGGVAVLFTYGITFFLVALIGGIIGLIVSVFSRKAMTTTSWILLLTLPQLILSGSIIPSENLIFPFNFLSGINPARYALETLLTSGGSGGGSNLLGHWLILTLMILCLFVLLLIAQRGAGNTSTIRFE